MSMFWVLLFVSEHQKLKLNFKIEKLKFLNCCCVLCEQCAWLLQGMRGLLLLEQRAAFCKLTPLAVLSMFWKWIFTIFKLPENSVQPESNE